MATVKVDMTGVEATGMVDEGEYVAVIEKAVLAQSQGGNDQIKLTFKIVAGTSKGSKVLDFLSLTETALWRLKLLLEAIGIKADGKIKLDTDKLVGKRCIIEVYHDEYNNRKRSKINSFTKIGAAEQNDDDDDDDEEEIQPKAKKKNKGPVEKVKKKATPPPDDDDDDDDDDEEEWE